ncbi:MAG: hypothetical protein FWE13_03165 [Firmicutes bacterium]|nr:hypothetical protein [Bacillota bacterium]
MKVINIKKKKLLSVIMVAIIIGIVLITTFTIIRCGSSNEGRIRGLDGGRFVVHFNRAVLRRGETLRLITSKDELVEIHKIKIFYEENYDWEYIWEQDWEYDWEYNRWRAKYYEIYFWNQFFESFLSQYDEDFFKNNHLVMVGNLLGGSGESFSIRRMRYRNGVLNIDFRRHRRPPSCEGRASYLLSHNALIEIPAICINLEIRTHIRNPNLGQRT